MKAFPQPSTRHEETVCCAGVTEDTGQLLRLFPIRYRRLPKENQFDRFDLVEMTVTKASDPRPESFKVDEASIRLIEKGNHLADVAKVKLWSPFITTSLQTLMAENKTTHRSLGIIKPDLGSLRFQIKPAAKSQESDQEVADLVYRHQSSLLEDPLNPIARPTHSFSYKFTCAGNPHHHQIHDWEVQAAFFHYKNHYKTEDKALEMMIQEYQTNIPSRNLHFIMGTMKAHPQTFILIGLLRTGLDPQELDKQGELFI